MNVFQNTSLHSNTCQLSLIWPARRNHAPELGDHSHKLAADRRMYCQLSSWSTTVQFITHWASTFVKLNWLHVSTIDMPWRNFSSPEFSRNFQTKVPWFYRQQYFLVTPCRTARKKIRVKKRPVTDTSRQTDRQTDRNSAVTSTALV